MAILIATIVTWIAVIVFFLTPKKISPIGTLFIFCADTIFELSVFSIIHVNLKLIVVTPGIGNGIADLMFQLIELPLLLVASSNILLYSSHFKWCGIALIILFHLIVQMGVVKIGTLTFYHWNILYSGIYMCGDVAFSRLMTWVITTLETKETVET